MIPPNTEPVDARLLLYVVDYYRVHGEGPSHSEMRLNLGLSKDDLREKLIALSRGGFLEYAVRPLVHELPMSRPR